jgi:hypothetical protein
MENRLRAFASHSEAAEIHSLGSFYDEDETLLSGLDELFKSLERHVPFLFGTFHLDFGYVGSFLIQISRRELEQRLAVCLLDDRAFDDKRPDVLEQVALVLVLELKLRQLLRVQVLEELCVISLKVHRSVLATSEQRICVRIFVTFLGCAIFSASDFRVVEHGRKKIN